MPEINFEMINEPNGDEVYAQEEFMRLIKPSDFLYCLFSYCLIFIKHDVIIKVLLSTVSPRSVFFKRVMRRKMFVKHHV